MKVGIGTAEGGLAFEAGQEAAARAVREIGEDSADFALVFSSPAFSSADLLEGVRVAVGHAPILGCTDAGNLTCDGVTHDSVVVMLLSAPGLTIRAGAGEGISLDSVAAGREMATQAREGRLGQGDGPGNLMLAFCDGSSADPAGVPSGVGAVLGSDFPVLAAVAAGEGTSAGSGLYCMGHLLSDSCAGFLLGGTLRFGVGCRHGWEPISRARFVTDRDGTRLRAIDGRAALDCYRDYLGEAFDPADLSRVGSLYPLGFDVEGEEEPLLRFPRFVEPDGTLVLSGEVPVDATLRLVMATRDSVCGSARRAAELARDGLGATPVRAAVVFSSFARERVMGREARREVAAIREVLGHDVPVAGLYGAGVIAPSLSAGGRARYRTNAIAVLAIGEE